MFSDALPRQRVVAQPSSRAGGRQHVARDGLGPCCDVSKRSTAGPPRAASTRSSTGPKRSRSRRDPVAADPPSARVLDPVRPWPGADALRRARRPARRATRRRRAASPSAEGRPAPDRRSRASSIRGRVRVKSGPWSNTSDLTGARGARAPGQRPQVGRHRDHVGIPATVAAPVAGPAFRAGAAAWRAQPRRVTRPREDGPTRRPHGRRPQRGEDGALAGAGRADELDERRPRHSDRRPDERLDLRVDLLDAGRPASTTWAPSTPSQSTAQISPQRSRDELRGPPRACARRRPRGRRAGRSAGPGRRSSRSSGARASTSVDEAPEAIGCRKRSHARRVHRRAAAAAGSGRRSRARRWWRCGAPGGRSGSGRGRARGEHGVLGGALTAAVGPSSLRPSERAERALVSSLPGLRHRRSAEMHAGDREGAAEPAVERLDRRRLARPVGADQRDHRPAGDQSLARRGPAR